MLLHSDPNWSNTEDVDRFLMSQKPSQRATRYTRIVAFGNHFRVEDKSTLRLVSYNSGMASMFKMQGGSGSQSSVQYVGVLKDILELDYGALHTRIILLHCKWVKPLDT